ncbi:dynactin subunit 3-like isoform X2 [Anguilla anguilla]|uniref:dynactin subunit 3-like isoform X2 n=1 Tax=Anguilla anguilla TaxID=7936 RepID=UPI0015ADDAD1|nr:dynactin subunit 3-like isoform X2 [Anguilla anguilla]
MEGVNNIEDFESRLLELEKRVYGERGSRNKQVKCADSLVKIQTALGSTANKRERIKILHKKIEDLMKYLDPKFTEHIAVSDNMKLEFILAAVPEHVTKLQHLSQIHMTQQDKSEALSAKASKQLEDYNKMMLLLSKQFSHWDETLRQLEEAKQVKAVD